MRGCSDAGFEDEEEERSLTPRWDSGLYVSSPRLIGSNFGRLCIESLIDLVSLQEMVRLHAISPTASCSLMIRCDEQILNSLEERNWTVMRDEWADFMFGSEGMTVNGSPCTELK